MSNTLVLERPMTQARTSLKDQFVSPAEEAHTKKIADNFRRLRFESVEDYNSAREGDPVSDNLMVAEPETEQSSYAASRLAQYSAVEVPAEKQDLFEGYVYKDGKLEKPVTAAPVDTMVVTSAPISAEEEDAVPTRRTMDTLRRPAAQVLPEEVAAVAVAARTSLSAKTKAVLIAVVTAVLLAIVLVCINSGIIRSIDADIAGKRAELDELVRETRSVQEQIADITSPESIAEWAAQHNMALS